MNTTPISDTVLLAEVDRLTGVLGRVCDETSDADYGH